MNADKDLIRRLREWDFRDGGNKFPNHILQLVQEELKEAADRLEALQAVVDAAEAVMKRWHTRKMGLMDAVPELLRLDQAVNRLSEQEEFEWCGRATCLRENGRYHKSSECPVRLKALSKHEVSEEGK